MSEENVNDIIEFRENEDNEQYLGNPSWFNQVGGSVTGIINPPQGLLTVASDFFMVTSSAQVNELSRQGTGILERTTKGEKLWKWEVR